MKTMIALLLKLTLSLTVLAGSVGIASWLLAEPVAHPFSNIDVSSDWTTRPVRVDPATQAYERLPPRPAPVQTVEQVVKTPEVAEQASLIAEVEGPAIDRTLVTGAIDEIPAFGEAHVQWCEDRYKSYRADDNSYQPYDGRRRQCASPFMSADTGEVNVAGVESAGVSDDPHAEWCANHYRSYRAEDNSYRSYSGRRRQCHSPHG